MSHQCDSCTDREGNPRKLLPKAFLDQLRKDYPSLMAWQDEEDRHCSKLRGSLLAWGDPPPSPPPSRKPVDVRLLNTHGQPIEMGSSKRPSAVLAETLAMMEQQIKASEVLIAEATKREEEYRSASVFLEQAHRMHNTGQPPSPKQQNGKEQRLPCEIGQKFRSRRNCHGMKRYQIVTVRELISAGEGGGADPTKDYVVLVWKEPMTIDGAKVVSFNGDVTVPHTLTVTLETLKKDFSKVTKKIKA